MASSFRGQVGWIPRLLGGEESRPCNHIFISRKPRPVPACAKPLRRRQGRRASHWPVHPQSEVTKGPFESSSPSHGSRFSDTDGILVWRRQPWLHKPGIRRNAATCLEPFFCLDYVLPFLIPFPYCSSSMIGSITSILPGSPALWAGSFTLDHPLQDSSKVL
jgi:hypothetical protein